MIQAMMGMSDDIARILMFRSRKNKKTYYEAFDSTFGKASGLNWMAEREQVLKGKGLSGAVFGRPVKGLGVGLSHLRGLPYFSVAFGAVGAFTAPKRHKVSGFVSGAVRTAAFALGDIIGTAIGGPVAGLIVGSMVEPLGGVVGDSLQMFTDMNRNIKHINMGGNYEDTRIAYTMRQRAAQEMGSSVMNARTWLGREGILLHQ